MSPTLQTQYGQTLRVTSEYLGWIYIRVPVHISGVQNYYADSLSYSESLNKSDLDRLDYRRDEIAKTCSEKKIQIS